MEYGAKHDRFTVVPGQKQVSFGAHVYDIVKPFTVFAHGPREWRLRAVGSSDYATYTQLDELRYDLVETGAIVTSKPTPLAAHVTPGLYDMKVGDGGYWVAPVGTQPNSPAWQRIGIGSFERTSEGIKIRSKDVDAWVNKLYSGGTVQSVGHTNNDHVHVTIPKEEASMKASEALRSQMTAIAEAIAAAEEKERAFEIALSREPNDFDANTQAVIYFEENFGRENGPSYTYVAVKANGKWYVTGRDATGRTWAEMVEKYHGIRHGEFWTAAKWVHAA